MKIKICGITDSKDAAEAVAAGADALGFMFYRESPRYLTCEQAAAITRALPPFVAKVGVFVDPTEQEVRETASICGLDTLQFHGEERPEFLAQFRGSKVIKAFRIRDASALQELTRYREADAWLLDSYVPGQRGGTGATFNWDLACQAKKLGGPIILAGGLTAENVAEAIGRVQPYGVDVSSGVEQSPGRKDSQKLRRFVQAVRGGDDSPSPPIR